MNYKWKTVWSFYVLKILRDLRVLRGYVVFTPNPNNSTKRTGRVYHIELLNTIFFFFFIGK